jgi:hypothetical protein
LPLHSAVTLATKDYGFMGEFIKGLVSNYWFTLSSYVIGILGIVISYYLYFKAKKDKLPYYDLFKYTIVHDYLNKVEGLEILYGGKKIQNLHSTKFTLWNGGESISEQDVAPADPIRIVLGENAQLLSAKLRHVVNPTNNFAVIPNAEQNTVDVTFDYFDKNEGMTLLIYHTGDRDNVHIKGTIKGVGPLRQFSPQRKDYLASKVSSPMSFVIDKIPFQTLKIAAFIPVMFASIPIILPALTLDKIYEFLRQSPKKPKSLM